ncbi:MAG: lactate utilization protein [Dehalococcoidia bacterium]
MPNEADITIEKRLVNERRAGIVSSSLRKRNIGVQYVPSREEALRTVLGMIPAGTTVARGDSVTVDQLEIIPELVKRGQNKLLNPFERDTDGNSVVKPEDRQKIERETFSADIFLTGTNAITLDGKIVSIDGGGNRVAAMIYGPSKVIIVVGVNKIVKDVNQALERIHQICVPMNAERHALKHQLPQFKDLPCVMTGKCIDCNHEWRMCRYTIIIDGTMPRDKGRINVILIGDDLGF